MKIESLLLPVCGTNCYLLVNEDTSQCIIIDPGSASGKIIAGIDQRGYIPVAVLLTHGHFDHAGESAEVASHFGIKIYACDKEKEALEDASINLSAAFTGSPISYKADVYLKDQEEVDLAGFHIRCLLTPGHTPGGCCYYLGYQGVCFTGDTLFAGSVGRTDFPGGSMSQIVASIRKQLLSLPEDTICYPGHGEATTVAEERVYNPYL